ncbi:MAG: tRNA (adenosine(37)-N6)-dimethylallyltransferase MiaA [Dehalococcoidia bacterium]|nr:tRNA (adenosine(37)-N6)-dimethylallyltransferase MiaA [Dehalococcoidia bacterium]
MNRVIAIVGPTAVGKSKLAISLAQALDGEVVNADSRQVYRYMDIGTAKPSLEEQRSIPHHLIDIVEPSETFSLALFQPLAYKAIEDILQRDKLPLLVGGSGLYVWSLIEGWHIPKVPPNPHFRRQMEQKAAKEGVSSLHRQLQEIDPEAARKIDPHNVRRVIRALEVYEATHTPSSQLQGKGPPAFDTLILGLTTHRDELYRRIDDRVDRMIKQGLVKEVSRLVEKGYGLDLPAMSSVGYRQIGQFLQGEIALSTAIQQINFETHRFARHQYAWFSLKDPRIRWFDIQDDIEKKVLCLVGEETKT